MDTPDSKFDPSSLLDAETVTEQTGFVPDIFFKSDFPTELDSPWTEVDFYRAHLKELEEECGSDNVFSQAVMRDGKPVIAIFVRRQFIEIAPTTETEALREHLETDKWLGSGQASPL